MRQLLLLFSLLPAASLAARAESHRGFADGLTDLLYSDDLNECTSALGVSLAFSLLYPSMTGPSKDETETHFGFPDDNGQLVWQSTEAQLEADYNGACGNPPDNCDVKYPEILISNSIWVDIGNAVSSDYSAVVGEYLEAIDLQADVAATMINGWVDDATKGLIDQIVTQDMLRNAIFVAINAIYLKANWHQSFPKALTNEDKFYTSVDRTVVLRDDALFMHNVGYFPYTDSAIEGHQVLQLKFFNESPLSMIFVLPTSDTNGELVSTTDIIEKAVPAFNLEEVIIGLPKFEFTKKYSGILKSSLQTLGVVAPFNGGICIFENDCTPSIDIVIQKTFISVDEKGVEAAAVTALIGTVSAPIYEGPVKFLADHRFQFFIYDETSDLVLFEGIVGDPEPQSDAPPAELMAKHEEADFWTTNFAGVTRVVDPANGNEEESPLWSWEWILRIINYILELAFGSLWRGDEN